MSPVKLAWMREPARVTVNRPSAKAARTRPRRCACSSTPSCSHPNVAGKLDIEVRGLTADGYGRRTQCRNRIEHRTSTGNNLATVVDVSAVDRRPDEAKRL